VSKTYDIINTGEDKNRNRKEWIGIRLFIALNFKDEVKAQIKEIIDKVKSNSIQGRFVKEEHMHLTLEFLGEIQNSRLDLIKEIMDGLDFGAFAFTLSQIGYFRRREGNIYWLGIKDIDALFNLQKKLHQSLIDKGFELEDREYKPHITIGREVKLKDGYNTSQLDDIAGKIEIEIHKVDLRKSEFANGRLIHSVIYTRPLHNARLR